MNQKPNHIKRLQALIKTAEKECKNAKQEKFYPYFMGKRDAYRDAIMLLQGHSL